MKIWVSIKPSQTDEKFQTQPTDPPRKLAGASSRGGNTESQCPQNHTPVAAYYPYRPSQVNPMSSCCLLVIPSCKNSLFLTESYQTKRRPGHISQ